MNQEDKAYLVLLYYCYTKIENPNSFRDEHHQLCLDLNLRGRIIIATEGLNGTVSGSREACEAYMKAVKSDSRFETLEFKVEQSNTAAFQKLNIRVKPEIVNSGIFSVDPTQKTGTYIEPNDFLKAKEGDDVVLLDVRSNYEHKLGKFKGARTLDIDNFREFKDKVEELGDLKEKKVITYCTGGIKCEKASAYLIERGFKDVYQLHGGIIKYGLETGGEDFDGSCYVFDNRLSTEINDVNPEVISKCHICETPSDRMVNCSNPECNNHVTICDSCGVEYEGACSKECQEHPKRRPYNSKGYYTKELNGYDPEIGYKRS